jgi:hypothetical protein
MAARKGKPEVVRPTLEEVKATTGKYLYVTYEGTEGGGWGLPAPRPRFAGDFTEELMIIPFEIKQIGEEWLDDPRFAALYERVKGIRVWRADIQPNKIDLTLPDELETRVNKYRQGIALIIAMSPWNSYFEDVINVRSEDVPDSEAVVYDHTDVLPFLKTIQFYEKRLLNRPEVMKAIEKRLREIVEEKPLLEKIESY